MLDATAFTCARCERNLPERRHGAAVLTQEGESIWHLCVGCLVELSQTPAMEAERARMWDNWLKTGRIGNG